MSAAEFAHDAIVTLFLLVGMWAVCSVIREDFDRAQRARRIFKGWRRRG